MIVGNQKPLEEILSSIKSRKSKNILVVGCDSCMNVSLTGGKTEVEELVKNLKKEKLNAEGTVLVRQCETRFAKTLKNVEKYDLIVSLGCSVGAQTLAEIYQEKIIIPGVDTSNMGAPVGQGVYKEKCIGCGSCDIERTGGICTLARCAKGLQNGPCGGSVNGKCEIDPESDCAWFLVYESLRKKGLLSNLITPAKPKDWSKSHSGGVRTIRKKVKE